MAGAALPVSPFPPPASLEADDPLAEAALAELRFDVPLFVEVDFLIPPFDGAILVEAVRLAGTLEEVA